MMEAMGKGNDLNTLYNRSDAYTETEVTTGNERMLSLKLKKPFALSYNAKPHTMTCGLFPNSDLHVLLHVMKALAS